MNGHALRPGATATNEAGIKASGASTGGAFSVIESRTTGGAPLHVHRNEDEAMYVIEGSIWASCGNDRFDPDPGRWTFRDDVEMIGPWTRPNRSPPRPNGTV